jgi:hypothetical protein
LNARAARRIGAGYDQHTALVFVGQRIGGRGAFARAITP